MADGMERSFDECTCGEHRADCESAETILRPGALLARELAVLLAPDSPTNRSKTERLGLRFADPAPAQRARLEREAESVGELLGLPERSLRVRWPAHGLLPTPLSPPDRIELDRELTARVTRPLLALQEGLSSVRLAECEEPMADMTVALRAAGCAFFRSSIPFHEACGPYAGTPRLFWLRRSLVGKLVAMVTALNAIGVAVRLEDGFRPREVQAGLFRRRLEWIRNQYPEWSEAMVLAEAATKTARSPILAGHMSGSAVDLTLCTMEGTPLDGSVVYPQGGARVVLVYPYLTYDQFRARELFRIAAIGAGWDIYPGESWHLASGDPLACALRGTDTARYTPLRSFDPVTGTVHPLPLDEMLVDFPPAKSPH